MPSESRHKADLRGLPLPAPMIYHGTQKRPDFPGVLPALRSRVLRCPYKVAAGSLKGRITPSCRNGEPAAMNEYSVSPYGLRVMS